MKIQHHVKYKEIHGVDEIIWMETGKHRALHNRLRAEGKCAVPVDVLHKISHAAHVRTGMFKKAILKYNREYMKKNRRLKAFCSTVCKGWQLHEAVGYNLKTGNISYMSRFRLNNKGEV